MKSEYLQNGYFLLEQALAPQQIDLLLQALSVLNAQPNRYGIRDLMRKVPYVRQFAHSDLLISIATEILGNGVKAVRSVYFDKLPAANWSVAWHQDTSIAVNSRADIDGFGPWSVKDGICHVEPSLDYLQNILTLRLHLDAADRLNGPLKVIPGSHRHGRIKNKDLLTFVESGQAVDCCVNAGDLLLMSPLLLHASHKAKKPVHRRIVHIEYSALVLPEPLAWYE
ncbi:MAG: phytanoyl-CoA dioxygenase family protein [Gammaproteobacteria bacterium]